MRQAGRYLPEYRALRAKVDFESLTRTPELAAEVTLQPLRRFELDAAILFSDIMTPLQGMGVDLAFEPGPVVREPIRSAAQIEALPVLEPVRDVPFVLETIRLVRAGVPRGVPLIGFAGAPFTLMCYLVCGRPSKEFAAARSFLYAQPQAAQRLLERLADAMGAYLVAQAQAGAQALMLFESWAGLLAPREFSRFALPAVRRTAAALRRAGVPLIYYVNQGSALMSAVADLDVDVIGVDWRSGLSEVRRVLGPGKAVQGNLDPAALFAPPQELHRHVDAVLEEAGPGPGHIFNLGHGIWPDTDPDAVARLIDYVHERG
jgi:uroporphyrinogen decarboxylase